MTQTNFPEWVLEYGDIFHTKYLQFCEMFSEGDEPSYKEFVLFIWKNTAKFKDPHTQKVYARIN
tara:strand:- start:23 stop:214 length:192 start_codon:yes stop_codon:yes gene_type:complete